MKRKLVVLGSSLALALGGSSPAFASKEFMSSDAALKTTGVGAPVSTFSQEATLDTLVKLSKRQSAKDIAILVAAASASAPVEVLVADDGTYIAAFATPVQEFSVSSITVVGPGCTTTSACIWVGTTPNGYRGTGQLSINLKSKRVFAGDHSTGFWSGNIITFAQPYVTLNWSTAKQLTSITRS